MSTYVQGVKSARFAAAHRALATNQYDPKRSCILDSSASAIL
jgi:hypothetical protein